MKDRYLNINECIDRLYLDWERHGKLLIAFDFDDTVYDFHRKGDTFPEVIQLLQEAKAQGHTLILFTGNGDIGLLQQFCKDNDLIGDIYLNESPVSQSRKPYYNILLDDRAGLQQSCEILATVMKIIGEKI